MQLSKAQLLFRDRSAPESLAPHAHQGVPARIPALALPGWASHKTSIDSLFLDEGFGSLDGDTLEVALTALDSRHASNALVEQISTSSAGNRTPDDGLWHYR